MALTPPFSRGERVRIVEDNITRGVSGFEGTVDQVTELGVVIILDSDPATMFRIAPNDRFEKLDRPIVRRFFQFNEIERIPGNT